MKNQTKIEQRPYRQTKAIQTPTVFADLFQNKHEEIEGIQQINFIYSLLQALYKWINLILHRK